MVSIDDDSCYEWLRDTDCLFVAKRDPSLGRFFYNDYCNMLKSSISDHWQGWFFFLDSDDYLADEHALENIAQNLRGDAWQAVVCQMSRDNGTVKPSTELIAAKKIESGKIGLPCLFLRTRYKDMIKIGVTENADYEYIKIVSESVSTKFVPKIVVHSPKRSYGK